MPSEWKFVVHSWIFDSAFLKFWLHSECIPNIRAHYCVNRPICFYHAKHIWGAFEVEKYRMAFELHSDCMSTIFLRAVTAFQQHSKHSDRLRRRIETASHFKSCQNVPNAPRMRLEWAGMHLECISIAAGIYFDIKRMQAGMQFRIVVDNLSIAAWMRLKFQIGTSRLALEWVWT